MPRIKKALLVFFNGKSNAGGAERMVLYLDEYLHSRGIATEILDERRLLNTFFGKWYAKLFNYRHFAKRRPIYMARFTSVYLWWRKRAGQIVLSNGESTPFYPVDYVINGGCYHVMEKDYGKLSDTLSRVARLQQRGLMLGKEVITVTEKVKQDLVTFYHIPAEKISVITPRVDSAYFRPLQRPAHTYRTVAYLGRLEPGKGLRKLQQLAAIIERTADWRLIIGCNNPGNTELFTDYRNTTVKVGLQLDNINTEGYSQADIIFYPSHSESFGMVTVEALSAGVPIVATDTGIAPELMKRQFPGVYPLPEFNNGEILHYFDTLIQSFNTTVDRTALHEQVKQEFGIATYREAMDAVMGKRILAS